MSDAQGPEVGGASPPDPEVDVEALLADELVGGAGGDATSVEDLVALLESTTTERDEYLDALLRNPANAGLRHTFVVWIKRLLRRKAGSPNIHDIESIHDLLEADTMLAERIDTWLDEVARKGMQQGRLEGEGRLLTRLLECRLPTRGGGRWSSFF